MTTKMTRNGVNSTGDDEPCMLQPSEDSSDSSRRECESRGQRITMTQRTRAMILSAIVYASVPLAGPTTAAAQQCQPGIDAAREAHRPRYDLLWSGLIPSIENLTRTLN